MVNTQSTTCTTKPVPMAPSGVWPQHGPPSDWLSGCQDCLQETWLPGLLESCKKWKVSKCVQTQSSHDRISRANRPPSKEMCLFLKTHKRWFVFLATNQTFNLGLLAKRLTTIPASWRYSLNVHSCCAANRRLIWACSPLFCSYDLKLHFMYCINCQSI